MTTASRDYLALRAEWLKAQGCLFDPSTGLPTVAAVLEEVRRRLEQGSRLAVVYLDLSAEEHLEEIYGWETYDALVKQVAHALLGLRGSLLAADDTVALAGIRSDQFVVFASLAPGETEAGFTRRQEKLLARLADDLRVQIGNERPRPLALSAAAAVIRYDPTVRIERSLYKGVDLARARCRLEREHRRAERLNELRRILSEREILIRYQPIVRLGDGEIFGFEALACGTNGDLFDSPEMLFSFAEETDQILELERLCRMESVRGAARLGPNRRLFLNCSAHVIEDIEQLSDGLIEQAEAAGLAPQSLVLEITERVAVRRWEDFRRRLDRLREKGFGVAIDDMGSGYSSLQSVAEVEPDYLKFDLSLVRDIHLSPIKRGMIETLLLLANRIDAQAIAEGVEKEEELETLREMGVGLGQGYLFSPPSALALHIPEVVG